jgi:actin-related protein
MNINETKKIFDINSNIRDDNRIERIRDNPNDKNKNEKGIKISEDNKMMNMLLNKMKEMETEYDLVEHIVIDIGNAVTKIGFSGEDLPAYVLPSIYGEYKYDMDKKNEYTVEMKSYLYGYEAIDPNIKDNYNVKFLKPGDHKNLIDYEFFDFLKEILENKLNLLPSDYKVMLNISPIKNPENIIRLGKILFDDMNFKAFALINSASLSLFSTGRTSGLIVECGEARSYTVPIYEGFPLYHALNKNRIGGRDLTKVISDGIIEAGLNVSPDDLYNLRMIKEKMCSVPHVRDIEYYMNSNEDIISQERMLYKLPDEKIISIPKKCRLKAADLLFK